MKIIDNDNQKKLISDPPIRFDDETLQEYRCEKTEIEQNLQRIDRASNWNDMSILHNNNNKLYIID